MESNEHDLAIWIELPNKPHKKSIELREELLMVLPNSKKLEERTENNEDDVILKIHQDIEPVFLVFCSKANQFVFKIIEYRSRASIGATGIIKKENPQLILTKFTTDLGLKVADFFMSIFPVNIESTQVVNFSVHKDFIFFRMYRTCITQKGPIFEKLGPHLSLRLWRIIDYEEEGKKVHNFQKYRKHANLL